MNIQNNQLYQGDCAEVLKSFPDNFVASCISNPPYNYEFIGRQWNDSEIQRRKDRVKDSKTSKKTTFQSSKKESKNPLKNKKNP